MQPWLDFWNRAHRIYVSDRHQEAHYRKINEDLLTLLPQRQIDLLDWGCGNALGASALAAAGVRLSLFDRASAIQAALRARLGGDARIRVLDEAQYLALPPGSFDVILINSVLQYLSETEFASMLPRLRTLLRPGGRLLIGDVIPPDARTSDDVRALLSSAWKHGYFLAALGGLAATFFSDYRQLRQKLGLTSYKDERILSLLKDAGLTARKLPRNIGFSWHRGTFEAVPAA